MIGKVEHVDLKVSHFKQAQYWKLHFFEDYDDIIQQYKVCYTLNWAACQILSKNIYVKIKSFYKRYDTRLYINALLNAIRLREDCFKIKVYTPTNEE